MPLPEEYPDCVAFVCEKDLDGAQEPRGTAFLVSLPAAHGRHEYAVTAKHVIADGKPTTLRLRRVDGGPPDDEDVPTWHKHPDADVAVAPVVIDDAIHIAKTVPEGFFVDRLHKRLPGGRAHVSDPIFYIGLLRNVPSMKDRAIPMVRGGCVGALFQRDVPMWDELHKQTIDEPYAHLIDCHSFEGFSGSPVFVGKEHITPDESTPVGWNTGGTLALLGVLIGYFNGTMAVGGVAGVAVVTPIECVRELIETNEDLVQDRERRELAADERRAKERRESAARQSSVPAERNDEFENFEDLTRKLVNTPKPKTSE